MKKEEILKRLTDAIQEDSSEKQLSKIKYFFQKYVSRTKSKNSENTEETR